MVHARDRMTCGYYRQQNEHGPGKQRVRRSAPAGPRANDNSNRRNRRNHPRNKISRADHIAETERRASHQQRGVHRDIAQLNDCKARGRPGFESLANTRRSQIPARTGMATISRKAIPPNVSNSSPRVRALQDDGQEIKVAQKPDQRSILGNKKCRNGAYAFKSRGSIYSLVSSSSPVGEK